MLNLSRINNKEERIIEEICLPLTHESPMALGLKDDIAIINGLLVKTDSVVEGIHYKEGTPPWKIARKLLARNLSDLAGKGATPKAYMLSVILPKELSAEEFLRDFAKGLSANFPLIGGDISATKGSLFSANITIFGEPTGEVPFRFNAKEGDNIYVTGKLGGAFLGFKDVAEFLEFYELPEPKLALGQKLVQEHKINAMMDVSDGILLDLSRLLKASGIGAKVLWEDIPSYEHHAFSKEELIAFGDDYELLFTSPGEIPERLATKIGTVTKEPSLRLQYTARKPHIASLGFSHL